MKSIDFMLCEFYVFSDFCILRKRMSQLRFRYWNVRASTFTIISKWFLPVQFFRCLLCYVFFVRRIICGDWKKKRLVAFIIFCALRACLFLMLYSVSIFLVLKLDFELLIVRFNVIGREVTTKNGNGEENFRPTRERVVLTTTKSERKAKGKNNC